MDVWNCTATREVPVRARSVVLLGLLIPVTSCMTAGLRHQAAVDHQCNEDQVLVLPMKPGAPASTTEVNVCGKIRRYRSVDVDASGAPVWLDATDLVEANDGQFVVKSAGGGTAEVPPALLDTVAFDHQCDPAKIVLLRSRGSTYDLDVCGKTRRYKALEYSRTRPSAVWLDVTSLYPPGSLPGNP